jgi:hypothetical protein
MAKDLKPLVTQDLLKKAVLTNSDFQKIDSQTKSILNKAKASDAYGAAKARGFEPPLSNTGEKENSVTLVMENGKPKSILKRTHYAGTNCIIDAVNVVFHESTFLTFTNFSDNTEFDKTTTWNKEIIINASLACEKIFGFGYHPKTQKRTSISMRHS